MANFNSSHTGAEIDSAVSRVKDTAVTAGTVTASKGIVVDANKDISGFRNVTLTGQLQAATINLTGDTTIGDGDTDNITINADVNSNIIPNTDNTFDLGSASKQWKDLYVNGIGYIDQLGTDGDPIAIYASSGEIDGTAIGSESASTGAFTTLTASGDVNFDSNTLFVDASESKVSIGHASPSSLLDVRGNSSIVGFGTDSSADFGETYFASGVAINFGYGTNSNSGGFINYRGYQNGDTQFRDLTIADGKGGTVAFFDGSAKSVGIGTTSPSAGAVGGKVLHLQNSGATASVRVDRSDASTTGTLSITSGNTSNSLFSTGSKNLTIATNSTTALTIDSSQNSTFAGTITADDDITLANNKYYQVKDTAGSAIRLLGLDNSDNIYMGFVDDANGTGSLYLRTGGTNALTIDSSQKVGIHTTSPNVGSYSSERGVLTISSTDNASLNNYAVLELQGHANSNDVSVGDISWLDHTNQNAIVRGGRDSSSTTGFLSFFTNGGSGVGERMRITSAGDVMLGNQTMTDHTYQTLGIRGDAASGVSGMTLLASSSNTSQRSWGLFANNSAHGSLDIRYSSDRDGTPNANTAMVIDSSGNVGIGDTSPTSDSGYGTPVLRVQGSTFPALSLKNSTSGGEGVVSSGNAAGLQIAIAGNATASNNYIMFRTGNTNSNFNSTERMRITSSGDMYLGGTASGGTPALYFYNNDTARAFIQASSTSMKLDSDSGFEFHANNGASRVDIDSSGNVGIGDTAPSTPLTSFGSASRGLAISNQQPTISFTDTDVTKRAHIAFEGSSRQLYLSSPESDGIITFQTGGFNERMRITSDGHLLTGVTSITDTSSRTFGNAFSGSSSYSNWTSWGSGSHTHAVFRNGTSIVGTITTTSSGTAYNETSDYRLKENQVLISDGLTRLNQLKPYRFNFIADADTTVDGFFAHEVAEIVPEAVTGEKDAVDDEGNIVSQGIDKSKLVPLLVKALQEADDKIDALTARIEALEA